MASSRSCSATRRRWPARNDSSRGSRDASARRSDSSAGPNRRARSATTAISPPTSPGRVASGAAITLSVRVPDVTVVTPVAAETRAAAPINGWSASVLSRVPHGTRPSPSRHHRMQSSAANALAMIARPSGVGSPMPSSTDAATRLRARASSTSGNPTGAGAHTRVSASGVTGAMTTPTAAQPAAALATLPAASPSPSTQRGAVGVIPARASAALDGTSTGVDGSVASCSAEVTSVGAAPIRVAIATISPSRPAGSKITRRDATGASVSVPAAGW